MTKTTKNAAPFSLRLTFDERAKLKKMANGKPLGAFIRTKIFDASRDNKVENQHNHAQILGMLGQSELTKNMQELADASRSGSLPLTPDTEKMLHDAFRQRDEGTIRGQAMILKASQRGGARQLAAHLLNTEDNEHCELHDIRGFMSADLQGAL